MSRWPMVALSEVAHINPRLTHSLDDLDDVTFVPMSSLDADAAITTNKERVPYGTVKKGYTPFLGGDLLIAKITPCFENSKLGGRTSSLNLDLVPLNSMSFVRVWM